MNTRACTLLKLAATGILMVLLHAGFNAARAQSATANLTGRVSSAAEGAMEGVLVSARKDGSNITFTVASDAGGRFDFAPAKISGGRYSLLIRAVGYELESSPTVDIPAQASIELKLRKTQIDSVVHVLKSLIDRLERTPLNIRD